MSDDLRPVNEFRFSRIVGNVAEMTNVTPQQHWNGREYEMKTTTRLDLNSLRARRANLAKIGLRCEASDLAIGLLERAVASSAPAPDPAMVAALGRGFAQEIAEMQAETVAGAPGGAGEEERD